MIVVSVDGKKKGFLGIQGEVGIEMLCFRSLKYDILVPVAAFS